MAYTNSVETGPSRLAAGTTFTSRPDVGGHRDRRVRSWPPRSTTAGSRRSPGRSMPSSSDCSSLTLAIGNGVGGSVALGRDRSADVPVQRARQDPDDRRAGQLPRRRARPSSTPCPRSSGPACSSGRRWPWSCSSPTSARRSCSRRSWPGMLCMSGASLRWLGALAAGVAAMSRSRGRTSCATTRRPG